MAPSSNSGSSSAGSRKAKLPRSCATCHARKVKCDLLRVCTACKRHARSTGKNEADIVCVYSIPPPPEPVHDGNVSSSSESSAPLQTRRRERQVDDEDIDYDFSASGDSTGNRTSKRRRRATAAALSSFKQQESQSYIPKGMGCGRDARRPDESADYYPSQYRYDQHAHSPIDYSLSSPPPNDFLPTPVASPTSTFYFPPPSMSRNVSMTFLDSNSCHPFHPSIGRRMSKSTSASLNLAPFDFNTFHHAQPYDSPISEFHFDFVSTPDAPVPLATPMLETRSFFSAAKPTLIEIPGEAYPSPSA